MELNIEIPNKSNYSEFVVKKPIFGLERFKNPLFMAVL